MRQKERPGTATGAPHKPTDRVGSTETTAPLPVASAVVYAPAGRRARWLALASCPHCALTHVHFGPSLGSLMDAVRSGCGREYRLHITSVTLDAPGSWAA